MPSNINDAVSVLHEFNNSPSFVNREIELPSPSREIIDRVGSQLSEGQGLTMEDREVDVDSNYMRPLSFEPLPSPVHFISKPPALELEEDEIPEDHYNMIDPIRDEILSPRAQSILGKVVDSCPVIAEKEEDRVLLTAISLHIKSFCKLKSPGSAPFRRTLALLELFKRAVDRGLVTQADMNKIMFQLMGTPSFS